MKLDFYERSYLLAALGTTLLLLTIIPLIMYAEKKYLLIPVVVMFVFAQIIFYSLPRRKP